MMTTKLTKQKGEGEDPKDPRMTGTKQKRKEKAKKRNQMSK